MQNLQIVFLLYFEHIPLYFGNSLLLKASDYCTILKNGGLFFNKSETYMIYCTKYSSGNLKEVHNPMQQLHRFKSPKSIFLDFLHSVTITYIQWQKENVISQWNEILNKLPS